MHPSDARCPDELDNEQLQDLGLDLFTRDELSLDLDRVANTIRRNIMSGAVDLTYFFERERVLNDLLDSDVPTTQEVPMPTSNSPACADCGTRGNVCRDTDGVRRCSLCSKAAFDARALDAAQDA